MRKRWVGELLAACELVREVAGDVVPDGVRERRRVRLEGLDDHLSRRIAPAPPCELRDELERPLLGPEVGEGETRVRIDDRGDLDAREVVALRHHLRADQNCRARRGEPLERLAQSPRPGGGVRIEADPLESGHPTRQLGVEPLRACTDAGELDRAALRARLRHLDGVPAVVAVEPGVPVQRQCDVAAAAAPRRAAGAAVDRARQPPAIEEKDRSSPTLARRPRARRAVAPTAGTRPRGGDRRASRSAWERQCATAARAARDETSSRRGASRCRTRRQRPRAPPAWPRPCERRTAGPTPA